MNNWGCFLIMRMKKKNVTISDFNIATCLCVSGANLLYLDRTNPKRVRFVFEDEELFHRIMKAYWDRSLSYSPQDLFEGHRELKNRLYNE